MSLSQNLTLRFKKSVNGATLHVHRADGTLTWTKLHPGMILHDLAHYAVETTLGLERAFYGLLAEGYDIGDFEAPKDKRLPAMHPANLPAESLQVEHLINLLLTEMQCGSLLADFREQLATILRQSELPLMPVLTEEALNSIREQIADLRGQWFALAEGETLSLSLV